MTLEEALKRYGGKSSPREEDIQKSCINWFDLVHGSLSQLMFHVANEDRQSARKGHRYRLLGVRSGVSDLIMTSDNGHYNGLCIEMKTLTGTQRKTQKEFQKKVEKQDYKYMICRSLDDFMREIDEYLKEGEEYQRYLQEMAGCMKGMEEYLKYLKGLPEMEEYLKYLNLMEKCLKYLKERVIRRGYLKDV